MSVTPETLNRINSLKQGIEAATGETYTDLTEGVQALKDGYGQGEAKEEQEKTVDITENGTVEIVPDEGKVMSKVTANVTVNPTDIGKPFIDTSKMTDFDYFCQKNRLNNYLEKLDTSNGTSFNNMFTSCSALQTIPQLDTSNGTNFAYMFDDCSALQTIPQLDTSKGTRFERMFASCSALTTVPQLDTSNGTNLYGMFFDCNRLTTIPQLDTSNGTNFSYMFYNCSKLKEAPLIDLISATSIDSMFYDCKALETVSLTAAPKLGSNKVLETKGCTSLKNISVGQGWKHYLYLHYSNELTVESLHGIIENLADLTGQTAKTFSVGATNIAKIDEEHITMLNNKNWNYS